MGDAVAHLPRTDDLTVETACFVSSNEGTVYVDAFGVRGKRLKVNMSFIFRNFNTSSLKLGLGNKG